MELTVKDKAFNVKEYLPFEDKSELIQIAYQEAIDSMGCLDKQKFLVLKTLYYVFYYTDLEFTDEEKANPFKTYDELYTSKMLEEILYVIPDDELEFLNQYAEQYSRDRQSYDNSFKGVVDKVVSQLPYFLEGLTKSFNEELLPTLQKQVDELKSNN